jgi:hypothetical protein
MIAIREVAIRCPTNKVYLVWLPKPIADDVVACPQGGQVLSPSQVSPTSGRSY